MRRFVCALAVLALSFATFAAADAQKSKTGMAKMPVCTPASNYVVWYVAGSNTYYTKSNAMYGKGSGKYVCRSVAVSAHAKMAHVNSSMGGSMSSMHGSMNSTHGSMGGSMSGSMSGTSHGSATGGTQNVPGGNNAPNPPPGKTSQGAGVPNPTST